MLAATCIQKKIENNYVVMYEGMGRGDKLLTNENRCIQFCDETPGCNSFTLCDTPMIPILKNCHLKDRLLNGSESSQYRKSCTTYYRHCGKIPWNITFVVVSKDTKTQHKIIFFYHYYQFLRNNNSFFTFHNHGIIIDHINNYSHGRRGAISFK